MIEFFSEQVPMPDIAPDAVREWIVRVAARHGRRVGQINYVFVNDERILEVNRQFLQHDYYTDIITFDYDEADIISGDLYISLDTVASNALQMGVPCRQELHRVLVHGVLHLCGINDKGPGERAVMERHENEALQMLTETTPETPTPRNTQRK